MSERFGVLWCPQWPVVAAGAGAHEEVVVLRAHRVVAVSSAAAAVGVRVGMRRRQAQSRAPTARLVAHDADRDGRVFERVARAVAEMVPRLEIGEPGMITFAARGPSRYFGGDAAMGQRLLEVVAGALESSLGDGVDARFGMGVADGRFTAAVAARRACGRGTAEVVAPDGSAGYLAPLPINWLTVVDADLSADFVGLLYRMGLTRLGDLAALDEGDVFARFAHPGRLAHRMAAGVDPRPFGGVDPPVVCGVERGFDAAHHSDAVVFAARGMAEELLGELAATGRVCSRLTVAMETEHGERSERVWHRPHGFGVAAVVERVRWQLDGWVREETLTAGVVMVRLDALEVHAATGVQPGMWGERTRADEWAVRAVGRLVTIAGEAQVLVPERRGGRLPSERFGWVPAHAADLEDPLERLRTPPGPWPGSDIVAPTVVHDPPVEIEVRDEGGGLVEVSGRGVAGGVPWSVRRDGVERRVRAWAGPWMVEARWWDPARARRLARFQLVLDDGSLLEAAVEHRRWWLLGEHA